MVEFVNDQISKLLAFLQTDEEEGQGLVEYALIISLVAVVAVVTLAPLGDAVAAMFSTITGSL